MIGPVLVGGLVAAGCVAVAFALRSAARAGVDARSGAAFATERTPEPAPVPARAVAWMRRLSGSRIAWTGVSAVIGQMVAGPVVAVAAAFLGASAFSWRGRRLAGRRAAAMDEGMADGVRAIAAGLRAGLSVPQAIRFAADEAEPQLSDALSRVVDAVDVGEPLEEAIARWASDAGTDDARLVEGVLGLHRRSGGDLPRVLDRVAETLRERRAVNREVRALTAQARLSGAILGLLPIGFFAFLWLTSRKDIEGAFRTTAGLAAFGVGVTFELIAFVWIRKLLEVR